MNQQERLFAALSGVDEELLERCARSHTRRGPVLWLAAAAACAAALALAVWLVPGDSREPVASISPPPAVTDTPSPTVTVTPGPTGSPAVTPPADGEEARFQLLQLSDGDAAIDFVLYINPAIYQSAEEDGVYVIRPAEPMPDYLPDCWMEIAHRNGSVEETTQELYDRMSADWTLTSPSESFYLDSLRLCARKGLAWDSELCDVYIVDDGRGGCFTLSAFYFMEATEGHGIRFADMAASFEVLSPDSGQAGWLVQLKDAVSRLTPALFSNDLTGVEDLLSPSFRLDGYGEDVTPWLSIAAVDYWVDNDQSPTEAVVSIKHRFGGEDSYTFFTLGLYYDGQWYLDWEGLEK